jgi:hypothetical protein
MFWGNQYLISEAQSLRPMAKAAGAAELPVTTVPLSRADENREDADGKLETKRRCVGRTAEQ